MTSDALSSSGADQASPSSGDFLTPHAATAPTAAPEPSGSIPADADVALLNTLFRTAPVGLGFVDSELRFVRINDALAAMNGASPDAHIGRTPRQISAELADAVEHYLRRVLLSGQAIVGVDVSGRSPPSDAVRHFKVSYYPVRARDDRVLGVGIVVADVTTERRAAETVRRSEEVHRLLADASAALASSLDYEVMLARVARLVVPTLGDYCLIDVVESDGTLRRLAAVHALGGVAEPAAAEEAPPDERRNPIVQVIATGVPWLYPVSAQSAPLVAPVDPRVELLRTTTPHSAMILPIAMGKKTLGAITLCMTTGGARYTASDLAIAGDLARRAGIAVDHARLFRTLQLSNAELEAHSVELQDVTQKLEITNVELQRMNEQLEAKTAELEHARATSDEANASKSAFLAVMSHELRTPLTAVIGYTELLADGVVGPVNPTQKEQLERIRASGSHLLSLIEDILCFARIEAGREQVRVETVDIASLLEATRTLVEPLAEKKRLRLDVRLPAGPAPIETDPGKARQILLNLLANSVKFTERGCVSLSARLAHDMAIFSIADSGIGIPAEHLQHIFDPFWQADQAATRKTGGTGLGLSIARQLARLLGGDVTVSSTVGEGSRFTVSLPIAPAPQARSG